MYSEGVIDDKAQILADIKTALGERLTTVFVRQGKYTQQGLPANFQPDITVDHIGELRAFSAEQFLHV